MCSSQVGMASVVVVDELSDGRNKLFASVVNWLIVVPVGVLQYEIAVELVDLLQEEVDVGLVRVSKGEERGSFEKAKEGQHKKFDFEASMQH